MDTSINNSTSMSMLDVSLESIMDKQVLDMMIRDPSLIGLDHPCTTSNTTEVNNHLDSSTIRGQNNNQPETVPTVQTPQYIQNSANSSLLDESHLSLMSFLNFNESCADFQTRCDALGRVFPLTPQFNTDSDIEYVDEPLEVNH